MIAPSTPPSTDLAEHAAQADGRKSGRGSGARRSLLILTAVGAALVGVTAGIVLIAFWERKTMPQISRQELDQARELWNARGPEDYRMRIRVFGNQNEIVQVEVRDSQPVSLRRDDYTPPQKRTWQYWTAPGLFETISTDMDNRRHPEQAFGVSDPQQVVVRGRFDPQLGYPLDYHRLVLGGSAEIGWHVEQFSRLDPAVSQASHKTTTNSPANSLGAGAGAPRSSD